MPEAILVAEDNESLRVGVVGALEDDGYTVIPAANGVEAIQVLESEPIHVVVSDIMLGDISGVEILKKAKEINSETEVILMTAYATLDSALQALRLGASITSTEALSTSAAQHASASHRPEGAQDARGDRFLQEGAVPLELGEARPQRKTPG
jgi:DNA-binding NtrC family response regulator